MWLDVEKRLPPYTADHSGIMLFKGQRFVESHRHHSHMAGLYPFDTIDFSDPKTLRTVEMTYRNWTRMDFRDPARMNLGESPLLWRS